MFSGTVFTENCRKFQKYLWREVSAVFEDDYRYEDEEYHADDFEYIYYQVATLLLPSTNHFPFSSSKR